MSMARFPAWGRFHWVSSRKESILWRWLNAWYLPQNKWSITTICKIYGKSIYSWRLLISKNALPWIFSTIAFSAQRGSDGSSCSRRGPSPADKMHAAWSRYFAQTFISLSANMLLRRHVLARAMMPSASWPVRLKIFPAATRLFTPFSDFYIRIHARHMI